MRRIKFRGKSIYTNIFVYGYYYVDPRDGSQCVTSTGISQTIDVETLGQYTGLNDKNGKEIYEGDILVMDPEKYPDDDPCPYSVIFEDGGFRIKYIDWDESISKPLLTKTQLSILNDIVAGNIHENPELLQET